MPDNTPATHATAEPPSIMGTVRDLYANLIRPHPTPRPTPPRTITDDAGREIRLCAATADSLDALVDMYTDFDPGDRAQGTPPLGEDAIREWLHDVREGFSVIARSEDRVVGQIMFVPDGVGRHELAIFVHPDYQRAGIGTALLQTGLGYAAIQGATKVWLTVEARKRRLEKLYCDVGFTLDNPLGPTHRLSQYL